MVRALRLQIHRTRYADEGRTYLEYAEETGIVLPPTRYFMTTPAVFDPGRNGAGPGLAERRAGWDAHRRRNPTSW